MINQYVNRSTKHIEGIISRTEDSGAHLQDRHKGRTNRRGGCKNRQNTIPTILAITIPTITAINIAFRQYTKSLTEGIIDIKGDVSTGYRTDALIGGADRR